jgi:hypothetical protein
MLPVWIVQACYRFLQAAIYVGMWRGGRWRHIKV